MGELEERGRSNTRRVGAQDPAEPCRVNGRAECPFHKDATPLSL